MTDISPRKASPRLGLISLGCPKNTVDSERLLGELGSKGWSFTSDTSDADCLVVNTCGFLNDARLESEEAIREIVEAKDSRPDILLVVTGCMPQNVPGQIESKFPEVDLVVGVGNLGDLPSMIDSAWKEKTRKSGGYDWEMSVPGRATLSQATDPRLRLTAPWTAYMKISEGCDHRCAFCTIPHIKGDHVSRPVDDLVREAEILAADGVREIILVSQDTTHYGSDIGTNLRNLLKGLDEVDGIDWIRMHYLYPGKVTDTLLGIVANSKRIIPYFDIPIQHSEPRILAAMNRIKPETDLVEMMKRIRGAFDGNPIPACIRSTLITGFPGETDEDFGKMLDFIHDVKIDRLTVFTYSPESGTTSYDMDDQVEGHIARDRMEILMEAQMNISQEVNTAWVGKSIEVLLEGYTDEGIRVGRSYRDAPEIDGLVMVEGIPDEIPDGNFVEVKITEAHPYDLKGEAANHQ